MLKSAILGAAAAIMPLTAFATETLTLETTSVGSSPHYIDTTFASILQNAGIADLQVTEGATLTNSVQAVAEGRLDIAPAPLILPFLMSKGIGPYSGLGPEKGAELASNVRAIFFMAPSVQIFAYYNSNPIDDITKLDGKRIWNGPPRGAALTSGRATVQLLAGLKEGEGYEGVQTPWPDAIPTITSGKVDAWTSPDGLPSARQIRIAAAGGITIHDIPSEIYNSELGQQIANAPGHAPVSIPIDVYRKAYEGNDVTVVVDDDTFDSYATAFAEIVPASMDEELVFNIVTAFLEGQERMETSAPIGPHLNMTFADIDGKSQGVCGAVQIKMHPGAIRAFEAKGHTVADCLRP
ncbi:hypothetical protein TRP8649_01436 [Pelagimonas phthalicica]|uniref:TRAP transporter solute receptor, TAXI family n=1 Tax=Pelagimonas phthalicica TaxID=1037362 RepID=A0A238JBJ3_9RHOB|nr:TAXI family TRAP transporter solute-binding subunit [Pelagimonas phthalicica]TDS94142.1 hypothetical protein CLV87_0636 [Pelagimonas phthalicica]SMX27332.1 hypothetical protein TRP8649_01436 [Pelagimonas phthalicica]